jgi:hypothetical protein
LQEPEGLVADERRRARFLREARSAAAAALRPNLATIFDVGGKDGGRLVVIGRF